MTHAFIVSCCMTQSQKKVLRSGFKPNLYSVKTYSGDASRTPYTLYSLWDYPTYLAVANELDELVEQWPQNMQRTVALIGVRKAFFENGAPHWEESLVWTENQSNIHALMLYERQKARGNNPELESLHTHSFALAEIKQAESQRRKQGSLTGKSNLHKRRKLTRALRFTRYTKGH